MFSLFTSRQLFSCFCFFAFIVFCFSCKKSTVPVGGSFSYTVTDTNGVVHNYADVSNLIGGLYYYNSSGVSSQKPSGYISNQNGLHYFVFVDYGSPATNNIFFNVPAYNQSISGDTSSTTSSVVINYTSTTNGLNLVTPVSYTITTKIADTTAVTLTGSFSITGMTSSGKTIAASGNFGGFGFF